MENPKVKFFPSQRRTEQPSTPVCLFVTEQMDTKLVLRYRSDYNARL